MQAGARFPPVSVTQVTGQTWLKGRWGPGFAGDRFQLGGAGQGADPFTGDLRNAYLVEPGGQDLLGTDTPGRDVLSRVLAPWVSSAPGLAIGVAVLGFNLAGDTVRKLTI